MRYFIISIVITFFGYLGLLRPLQNIYFRVVSPLRLGMQDSALALKSLGGFFRGANGLREENLDLSQRIITLESAVAELKYLKSENSVLRKQLYVKSSESIDKDLITAHVLGNPKDPSEFTVVIDKGSLAGVTEGANVIRGRYILGIVTKVMPRKSLVELITSPSVSMTVYDVDSLGKAEGLAVGNYGTYVSMTRLLPGDTLAVGDMILTSGKDGRFYPGLLVGKVSYISQDPARTLREATIDTPPVMTGADVVFVLNLD